MKQFISDLKSHLIHDRKILTSTGILALAVTIFLFTNDQTPQTQTRTSGSLTSSYASLGVATSPDTLLDDFAKTYSQDLDALKRSVSRQETEIERLHYTVNSQNLETKGVLEAMVDSQEHLHERLNQIENMGANKGESIPANIKIPLAPPNSLEMFGSFSRDVPARPMTSTPRRITVITPGDWVQVELKTGVNAPIDGTPYPVIFELRSPIYGPRGVQLDIGDARIIAAAQGSSSDGRVLFRMTHLAIAHTDGRRLLVPIDGWIAGEDGIRGMQGKIIDKLYELVASTAAVALTSAFGDSLIARTHTITSTHTEGKSGFTLSEEDFERATATALSTAADRLGEVLVRKYEGIIPVVEILSGREVMAVFTSMAEIEEFFQHDAYGPYEIF